jgi:hypothetical protein
VDTLNAVLALLAMATVVVATFITRNHRHDFVGLGVPILGILFALIPLLRVSRAASEVPEQIEARLSASEETWNGEQVPARRAA